VAECYNLVSSQVKQNGDHYVWAHCRNPDHLGECRLAAMRLFLADFERGKREGGFDAPSSPSLSRRRISWIVLVCHLRADV
jgi:hypothetical protein